MKQYILDTHTLLWCIGSPESLSIEARKLILNIDNTICYSIFSLWEIAIKISIGKLKLETSFDDFIDKIVFIYNKNLSISATSY